MRILLIHNKYFQRGGEDLVFESERDLLVKNGHTVESLVFTNEQVNSWKSKLKSAIGAIYNKESHRKITELIKKFNPDIIHVHNFLFIASPALFYAAYSQKVPVVLTLHNFRLICPSATLFFEGKLYTKSVHKIFPLDAVFKGVYRNSRVETLLVVMVTGFHKLLGTWKGKVTRYIALTEFSKRRILDSSLKIRKDQILVKPNFVIDYGASQITREAHFLFVGRLSEEKGIEMLLQTASQNSRIGFKIIGDGPLRSSVEKYAANHTNIDYLGYREKGYIIDQMKKAKALVFPSLWYEGFPMTILEAFSCGTPVIAADLGGPKEIISNQVNGLLFDPNRAGALLSALEQVSNDLNLHSEMSKNARKSYVELYTPEKNYQQLIQIYNNAVKH